MGRMKSITEREFAAHSTAVLDDVEAGETYHVTRNGAAIAELRPPSGQRRFVPVEGLQSEWRGAPALSYTELRREADDFYGDEDRLGANSPRDETR